MFDNSVAAQGRRHVKFGVAIALLIASPVRSDAARGPMSDPASVDSASAPVDTGVFAHGRHDFSTYETPGVCAAAAYNTEVLHQRTLEVQAAILARRSKFLNDTTAAPPEPLAPETIAIAATCGARFRVGTTAPVDLWDLFRVAVFSNNRQLARDVVARRLALATADSGRAAVYVQTIGSYLTIGREWRSEAESLLTTIDRLGDQSAGIRILAHDQRVMAATIDGDRIRMRREADQIIALGRQLPETSEAWSSVVHAYTALLGLALVEYPDSTQAIGEHAHQDLRRFTQLPPALRDLPIPSLIASVSPVADVSGKIGGSLQPIHASFWMPGGADTVRPKAGTVSLLITMGRRNRCMYPLEGPGDVPCARMYSDVERWHDKYGAPLDVTLLFGTTGLSRDGVATPRDEMNDIRWFFRTYHPLPVSVALQETPVRILEDGRRLLLDQELPVYRMYPLMPYSSYFVVLANARGQLVYAGEPSPLFEAMLAKTLRYTAP